MVMKALNIKGENNGAVALDCAQSFFFVHKLTVTE